MAIDIVQAKADADAYAAAVTAVKVQIQTLADQYTAAAGAVAVERTQRSDQFAAESAALQTAYQADLVTLDDVEKVYRDAKAALPVV